MAINDFVRRSMQIVAGGIVQSTTNYFDNAISFTNDVKEVIDMGKQSVSDGAKKFNELRNSGILKKTRDWFYNEGGMFGDFDFDDDDFDAGFEIDSADDEKSEKPQVLSKDMMTDIAKKQTGAMYKALGRQADLHIANTAEIISTINTRTAELTASVNNVNNTLIQIGKRLDLIVEWTSARTKKETEAERTSSILDYGGGISLSGVANKFKENAEDSMFGTFMSIGKTMFGSGMMTPEMVLSMILSQTVLDKKWDKLGGKSVNDIGEFINNTVGEVIQNTMTSILTSKNNILEHFFENIISKTGGKNYQNFVTNQYNDKPAVFDGMTRKSIVTVIPGYLNEILKAVSGGEGKHINDKGNLVSGKGANAFTREVASSIFRSGTMEFDRRRNVAEMSGLSDKEVSNAVRTLTGAWIWLMYSTGTVILRVGQVKDLSDTMTQKVLEIASQMMASADPKKRSQSKWSELYATFIIPQIEEFSYRQELQRSAEKSDKNLESFARTSVHGSRAGKITGDVFIDAFKHNYKEFNSDAKFNDETPKNNGGVNATQIGSNQSVNTITTFDYVAGIFNQLNRGMNVFITGSNKSRKAPYDEIKMIPGYGKNANSLKMTPGESVSSAIEGVKNTVAPITNGMSAAIDAIIGEPDKGKEYNEAPDEIKDILDTPENERSEKQNKQLEKYRKKQKRQGVKDLGKAAWNTLTGAASNFAADSRKMGIVQDPESMEMVSNAVDNVKKAISNIIPDSVKDFFGGLKNKISETDAGKKAGELASSAKEKTGNVILGEKSVNEEGEVVRTGGVLHAVAKPLSSISGGVSNVVTKFTPTKTLQNKVNNIFDKYKEGGSHAPGGENFNAGNNDYIHIQILSSMADAAMANGEVSTDDKQTMLKEIAAIEDKDVQKRLKQYLIPLMERNSSKDDKSSGGSQPKSPFGKIGSMLLSAGKLVFGGIFVYIKGVIKSIRFTITKGLKLIFNFAKWGIARGLRQIKYGAKSFYQGMKQVAKSTFNSISKSIAPAINHVFKTFNSIKDHLKEGLTNTFSKWQESRAEKKSQKEAEDKQTLGKKIGGIPKGLSNLKSKFFDSIGGKGNGFMGGFFSARNERKAAEQKAKDDAAAKPMKDALEQTGIPEIKTAAEEVTDILKDTSGEKGFLKPVVDLLNKLVSKDENPEGKEGGVDTPETIDTERNAENKPQMEDLYEGQQGNGGKTGGGSLMPETGGATSTDLGGNKANTGGTEVPAATAAGGVESGGGGGFKNGLGKMLGGISSMMGGLLSIVISIVMSLEGVKAIMNLVMTIITESLKPLNEAFQALMKAFKPILKQLGGIIKQLAEFIVVIVDAVVDVIKPILTDVVQPILEVLSPLLESILGAITPILKIVSILLKVILAPLMGLFKFVLLPILKIIGDAVQIIMGVLQIGFGVLMMGIGGIISAIGNVLSLIGKIPGIGAGAKKLGSGVLDTGKEMMSQGKEFVVQGGKSVAQGAVNLVLDYASLYSMGMTDELLDRNGNDDEKKETKQIEAPDENQVESTFANGDVTNIYNTYGGEYQRGMGGYLNMNQRGCGPIALADMYNRNSEGKLSARSLAGMMNQSGAYDPRRGTSVGDYIDTARGLGMNVRAGKVTQQSLKSASPTNPITVVGSGSDYGTRKGNNHFMNVIGTDHHGGAYVSNPLTGRIDRRPASTVAGSAVMGIYGSGDEDQDGTYTFPDAVKEAFRKLKAESAKILGLFSMEKSDEEETEDLINAEKKKEAVEQAKKQMGDEYDTYAEDAKGLAIEDFKKKYPQRDNEPDEEYQERFDNWWETKANQAEYLAKTELLDAASENGKNAWQTLAATNQKFVDDYAGKTDENGNISGGLFDDLGDAYTKLDSELDSLGSSSNGSGGSGYFSSNEGVEMWTPYSDNIQITETDITKGESNAPLFEFFAKTMGLNLGDIYGSGWFTHYNNPNKEGVGSGGDKHSGVDFTGGEILGKPLYATTGGKVIANWSSSESGGGGNTVIWKDSAGKLHWYMHMDEKSTLNVGDEIEGGTLIGYVGNTGHSTGPHLHYTINDTTSNSGAGNVYNPLMYFSNYNPTGGNGGVALGDTDEEKVYSYLTTAGMTPIGASGLMGCFKYESDMQTNNLENSYNSQFGMSDTEYTQAVDSGKETEDQFISGRNATAWSGQTPGEAVGYGIAQFTSSNLKRDLYDKTVKRGKSIASLEPQLDAIISVLKERGIYDTINNAATPTDANKTFLWKYEAGTSYTSDAAVLNAYPWMRKSNPDGTVLRHQYAEQVYNTYKNWKPQKATNGFTDPSGNIKINSASDEKMFNNLQQTGSTSGKGTGIVVIQSGYLNVRKDKSINSDVVGRLYSGDEIEIEACNSAEWLYVPSMNGYVSSDFINVITNDNQDEDWGAEKYTGSINSASDAKYATEGYGGGTQAYKIYNYDGNGGSQQAQQGKDVIQSLFDNNGTKRDWWGKDFLDNFNNSWPNKKPSQSDIFNRIKGSGDADIPEMDFWDSYLGWNNKYANSNITTPVGEDLIDTTSDTYYDEATGTTVVNTYNVTRGEDKVTEERLRAILANTYNVRSESMEALLKAILDELKRRKGGNGGPTNTSGSTKLFDERIPSQVTKLSIG